MVTDDNPRNEAPERILGCRSGFVNPEAVTFVQGRAQAIARLIAAANASDVVVLAGKGHEDYQGNSRRAAAVLRYRGSLYRTVHLGEARCLKPCD